MTSARQKVRIGKVRIGISGWRYEPWRGTFYPEDLTQKRELEYASRKLNSIEINGTFYSLQKPDFFRQWFEATPDDFVFSVKCSRFITHMKRLKDVAEPTATFFGSGLLRLNQKLGPFLWQFPPNMKFDAAKFEAFFKLLPRDSKQAAALAKTSNWLKDKAWTEIDENRPLRHAVEIRHESFNDPAFVKLLKKHDIAIVIADTAGKWPYIEEVTSDFVYLRLHGDEELYVSGYDDASLDRWAKKICGWREKRDVFVYFDNDVKVRAPFDAMSLAARINGEGGADNCAAAPPASTIDEVPRASWPVIGRKGTKRAKAR